MMERLTCISLSLAFSFNRLETKEFAAPGSTLGLWLDLPASIRPVYTTLGAFFVALFGFAYT